MTDTALNPSVPQRKPSAEERYYMASQWELMRRKFRKHKLANVSLVVLALLYLGAIFCGFIAPYSTDKRDSDYLYAPPQGITFRNAEGRFGLQPYTFGFDRERNPKTLKLELTVNEEKRFPIRFFVKGEPYKILGISADVHLFGVDAPGYLYLMGTDKLGRDIFSRIWYGARVSLTIGLIGVALSFLLGCLIGGISGYYGGTIDTLVQRVIEYLISIPTIPLWMALAAAIPRNWPQYQVYFAITIILSLVGWCGLARRARQAHQPARGGLRAGRPAVRPEGHAHHRGPPAARVHELPHRQPDAGRPGHDPGRDRTELPRLGPPPA